MKHDRVGDEGFMKEDKEKRDEEEREDDGTDEGRR